MYVIEASGRAYRSVGCTSVGTNKQTNADITEDNAGDFNGMGAKHVLVCSVWVHLSITFSSNLF